jgi:uncharacterized protein
LADTNPWWVASKGVDTEVVDWPRRAYFPAFMRLVRAVDVRRAVVVIGPRRVGKTVMMLQAVQNLLDSGVPGTHILVAQLDVPLFVGQSLDSLMRIFLEMHGHGRKEAITGEPAAHPYYIFFDEIQYLKNWESHLKVLVDTQKQVRFIATGSSAAALRMKSQESGAGRFTDFVLPPLTFAEYLDFCGQSDLIADDAPLDAPRPEYRVRDIGKLNAEFVNYLNYGGFPEAVMNRAVREDPRRYLRQDIIDKVLQKDLPSLMGISDTQELNRFFNVLAYNTGLELSPNQLSKSTGISSRKIEEYLEYLEAAFLIKRLPRIDQTARRMQRATTYKVYLTNPSIRAALFGIAKADDEAMGRLVETAVWSQWLHSTETIAATHYARWRKGATDYEVDLVGLAAKDQKPKWAVEVKWSDRAFNDSTELKGLRAFLADHKLARPALVTTKTEQGMQTIDGQTVEFCPSSLHCYIVGKNLLR